ncbi:hypothetical protein AVEN_45789-1 [Araneus ventricosus]|uniref:Uncharacterized protein n=1 Tax=Araneus ventricosus TaxID=182803 RepID=A0A4Y2FHI3_ARAVE|nr:hypothetical protein AVEN_45789-1 [Araneus ventricosus]
MDKQFEKLFAMMAGLEQKTEAGEAMRSGQERMEGGRDEMKGMIEEVKGEVQKKIEEVEGKVEMRIEEVEHKVQGKIGDIERRLSELKDKPLGSSVNPEVMYSRPTVIPLTFDGLTSWAVFKTQFNVVSSTNGWADFVEASQLVASL